MDHSITVYKKIKGFTLLELLVCLSIIAIIIVYAQPSFHHIGARQELSNLQHVIQQHINMARSHAITVHSDVVMCASANLEYCQNNQWHHGILLYIDRNKNRQLDVNETVLTATATQLKYGSFAWHGNASHPNTVVFQSDSGLPRGSIGSFRYCSFQHPEFSQDFPIGMMGHLRSIESTKCNKTTAE
ncbi:type IV fimbrial biogenesis protein FimT [Acinetobacter calcoaceticus]|uniref:Type II secretion system protein H n=1 Tax=Acinetobacter calcoaceticus TaxID=471 RepID=A0A4R1XUF1_ACICA|nr:type IV fimbrial biogenesis protein FimT [Acinetobacter calcoaceticus]